MAGAKTLSNYLQTLEQVENIVPQKPLSIIVEMQVIVEKLNLGQGRMIAYEDFLKTEYRIIRT